VSFYTIVPSCFIGRLDAFGFVHHFTFMEPHAYEDLALLARICAEETHFAENPDAAKLWRLALDYQRRAAVLDGGRLPAMGPPPPWFKGKLPLETRTIRRRASIARRPLTAMKQSRGPVIPRQPGGLVLGWRHPAPKG
jgi:hypothetical protein